MLDLLQDGETLTERTARDRLARVPEIDLYALLGPPDPVDADPALINAALYRRLLPALRAAFDLVFVDTPVAELHHTTFTELILPEADAILVPVEPDRVTLEGARSWLRAITTPQHSRGGGVDPQKLSLILNRARADVDCGPEDVMDLLPGWRFAGVVPDDRERMQAVSNRRLGGLHADPELEATLFDVLRVVTADPVFETATPSANARHGRWRRLLTGSE
nr:hypothetical protein GCM10010200_037690 [Actinomadura rugatobispora]